MGREVIKKILKEATGDSSQARGSYILPMQPGFRIFDKSQLAPFNEKISDFQNAELYSDSLDGNMDESENEIRKMETLARKIAKFKKNHPIQNDEDGDNINPYPVKVNEWTEITDDVIKESNTSVTAGLYNGPLELGLKKWKKDSLNPFNIEVSHDHNVKSKTSKLKNNVSKSVGVWEKNEDGSHHIPTHDAGGKKETKLNEDLAVWFGKKKKPKGSKQPKGPWVNICKKVDGKHPPCGRSEATDRAYPKCRAAGVAGKMSDSEKRSACQQKRKAEKSHPKTGTGNKPKMVSYKPKNESYLRGIIRSIISEQITYYKDDKGNPKTLTGPMSVPKGGTKISKDEFDKLSRPAILNTNTQSTSVFKCVPLLFIEPIKKFIGEGYDKRFLKASLGVIGRESDFGTSKRYTFTAPLKSLWAYVGGQTSVGPGQIKPETAEKYGLEVSDLNTSEGSLKGVYKILRDNYNTAIKMGYSDDKPSVNFSSGTGSAALDMAIIGFNLGQSKIVKYCKTTNPNIKKPCSMAGKVIEEQSVIGAPTFGTVTTSQKTDTLNKKKFTVLNEWVPNYLPNYKSERWDGVNISSHGYVKEVASKIKNFNCF